MFPTGFSSCEINFILMSSVTLAEIVQIKTSQQHRLCLASLDNEIY